MPLNIQRRLSDSKQHDVFNQIHWHILSDLGEDNIFGVYLDVVSDRKQERATVCPLPIIIPDR